MLASGFAGLGYQIVWTQQSALWLGHESAAVLAVVAAFFGGLAFGALVLGRRIHRSSRPVRWYAWCEAAIGLWSFALALLFAPLTDWLVNLIGPQPSPLWHWTVAFCGTFLLLLPATAAMGATLPAMEKILAPMRNRGTRIAALYAGNTFGAVLGTTGAAFWLVPEFGLTITASVCAVLNLLCAVTAFKCFAEPASDSAVTAHTSNGNVLMLLAATGLLGIGYEVLVVRVLSQVAENTVYTFAILLAVYLIGTALGAAGYARWLAGASEPEKVRNRLLQLLTVTCVLGVISLASAGNFKAAVLHTLGSSMAAALTAEAALAMTAFLLPTIVMGALFSHLATSAAAAGIGFGQALGVNTLGAAAAPLLFGVVLVTGVGSKFALLIVAAGYLALSSRRAWLAPGFWAAAAATFTLAIVAPSLALIDIPEGGKLISHKEGALASVSVVADANGVTTLHINNRQQEGSSATLFADARQALLPLLLHPSPTRALFLGVGTGVTSMAAAGDSSLHVDAVELLPEVIEASAHFTRLFDDTHHSRPHVMAADARRFVRASRERHDVIVSDNFHPARSGSGSLYTVEHFQAVHRQLATDGVFCQWLPLHQLDLDTLRSIVRSFLAAFPNGYALLATNSLETPVVGLIARADADRFDLVQLRNRLTNATLSPEPADLGIEDDLALLGSFIAGPRTLARFSRNAPLNTDDHPVVAYRAPRITYVADSLPRDRLIDVLRALGTTPDELLTHSDIEWTSRLARYWTARNRFIEAGRDVRPTADVQGMLAQVREPLLSVLQISPDFRPAYDPLLQMATALNRIDAHAARELLIELQGMQPARPEARVAAPP
jgi:spermidine synthase